VAAVNDAMMKLGLFARLSLQWVLLCLALGACAALPNDPTDRFAFIKNGMTREQVEGFYGPPTHWVLYYEPEGFAVFSYDKLLSTSKLDNPRTKPDWPIKEGMSVSEVRKIMGNPTKACAGEYYTEPTAHWFCYKNDVLISKEKKLAPFS
jgi:hypothetical protein